MEKLIPYLFILAGVVLRTVLPYVRAALFYMRDNADWPKFEPKFWIPPLATFGIDLIAFLLGLLIEPEITQIERDPALRRADGEHLFGRCGEFYFNFIHRFTTENTESTEFLRKSFFFVFLRALRG